MVIAIAGNVPSVAQAEQQGTFRSETEFVIVPVTVRDRAERHVSRLVRDNFAVRLNGKEVELAVVEEVRTPEETSPASTAHEPITNQYWESQNPRVTVILLDLLNSGRLRPGDAFGDRVMALRHLRNFFLKYAEEKRTEPVALYTVSRRGLRVLHDFTHDAGALAAALERLPGEQGGEGVRSLPPIPGLAEGDSAVDQVLAKLLAAQEEMEEELERFERRLAVLLTLRALREIGELYHGVPGKKSLVWITGGTDLTGRGDSAADISVEYQRAWRSLNNSMFALYPVDIRGLVVVGHETPRLGTRPRVVNQREAALLATTLDAMRAAARDTGGRAYVNRNDLGVAIDEALSDSRSYYVLGFYAPTGSLREGWQRLAVSVKGRREATAVRHRAGFYVTRQEQDPGRASIAMSLSSPVDLPGVPLQVRVEDAGRAEERRRINVHLTIGPNGITLGDQGDAVMECVVAARNAMGTTRIVGQRRVEVRPETAEAAHKLREGGIHYSALLEVEDHETSLRVVVLDIRSGRVGAVTVPLGPSSTAKLN